MANGSLPLFAAPTDGVADMPELTATPARIDAAALQPGNRVQQSFLLERSELKTTRNGDYYLDMVLRDRTGQLAAKRWGASPEQYETLREARLVEVTGLVERYRGELQLAVTGLAILEPNAAAMRELLPHSPYDPTEMLAELRAIIAGLSSRHLRELILSYLDDEAFAERLALTPAAQMHHHAYLGGLLEHILSLSRAALRLTPLYPAVDGELVLAGVFFHDLGKTRELSIDRGLHYTDEGRLVGHLVIGVLMLEERLRRFPGFPAELRLRLIHLILSHHGSLEFGSPKLPMTPEAILLHYIDDLDAKLWAASGALERSCPQDSWTGYLKEFKRSLYRGEPAGDPAE